MLIDHRTYTVRPGTMKEQIDLYQKHGFAVQRRHLGEPLAFLIDDGGEVVSAYVHIWVYEDAADRRRKRDALHADPEWQTYVRLNKEAGHLLKQEVRLMKPASFASVSRPAA